MNTETGKKVIIFQLLLTSLFLFSVLTVACKQDNTSQGNDSQPAASDNYVSEPIPEAPADGFVVCGTLKGGANQRLWLEEMAPDGIIFIDSIKVDAHGNFHYLYRTTYQSMYNLHTTPDNYIVLLPAFGETVKVTGKYENLSVTYQVDGSPESKLLWDFQQFTNKGSKILINLVDTLNRYDDLLANRKISKETYDARKAQTDAVYHEAQKEEQDFVHKFIIDNRGSLATIIALYKSFNGQPVVDPHTADGLRYYNIVLKGLEKKLPDNPHTIHFRNSTTHLRTTPACQQKNS